MSLVRVQGHRGWRARFPENTWVGFQQVTNIPVAAVEIDVVEGPGKELVVSHDPWFMDSEGRVKALRDYPKEEFTKLRVGVEPNPAFPNQEAHRSSILFLVCLFSPDHP